MRKYFYRGRIRQLKADILSGEYFRQLPDMMKNDRFRDFIKKPAIREFFLDAYRKTRNVYTVLGGLVHASYLYSPILPLSGKPVNAIKVKPSPSLKDLAKQIGLDHVPTWEEIRDKVESPDFDGSDVISLQIYRALSRMRMKCPRYGTSRIGQRKLSMGEIKRDYIKACGGRSTIPAKRREVERRFANFEPPA